MSAAEILDVLPESSVMRHASAYEVRQAREMLRWWAGQRNSLAAEVAMYLHDLDGLREKIEHERARLDAQHAAHRARMDADKCDDRRCREALAKFLGLRPTCPVESLLDVLESHQRSDVTELLRALDEIRRIAGRYAGVTI